MLLQFMSEDPPEILPRAWLDTGLVAEESVAVEEAPLPEAERPATPRRRGRRRRGGEEPAELTPEQLARRKAVRFRAKLIMWSGMVVLLLAFVLVLTARLPFMRGTDKYFTHRLPPWSWIYGSEIERGGGVQLTAEQQEAMRQRQMQDVLDLDEAEKLNREAEAHRAAGEADEAYVKLSRALNKLKHVRARIEADTGRRDTRIEQRRLNSLDQAFSLERKNWSADVSDPRALRERADRETPPPAPPGE